MQAPHAAQRRAPQQEAEAAKRLGGRRVRGSGCGNEKGDVRLETILRQECKSTEKDSFRVTRDMLRKLDNATAGTTELPVLEIEFINHAGAPEGKVCVMPSWALETLLHRHAKKSQ